MARTWSTSNNGRLVNSTTPAVTAVPLSIAVWFKPVNVSAVRKTLACVGATGTGDQFGVFLNGATVQAGVRQGASTAYATATGTVSAGTWTHGLAVFASATSRTAYQDGANAGSDATNLTPAGTFNTTKLGDDLLNTQFYGNGNGGGDMAYAAIWNVALTAADATMLGLGVSPLLVRPDALVFFAPLNLVPANNSEPDVRASRTLSDAFSNIARATTDPRVFGAGRQQLSSPTAVAANTSTTPRFVINSVDVTRSVMYDGTSIDEVGTESPNHATIVVHGLTPSAGQTVAIYEGSTLRFAGEIETAERHQKQVAADPTIYSLACTDKSLGLYRRLVQKQWSATAADTIAKDLIDSYCPGLTHANVDNLLSSVDFAVQFESPGAALKRLADLVVARFKVDYAGDLNFRVSSFVPSPLPLDASHLSTFRDLSYEADLSTIATRVFVIGKGIATTAAASVAAASIAVADTSVFSASGGLEVSGANRITYTGRSTTSGPGNLTGVSGVLYAILQGDTVSLFVQVDDAAAQAALAALEGGDGIYEFVVTDQALTSVSQLTTRGTAELALRSAVREKVTYTTTDRTTAIGADVTVNIDGINTVVEIQQLRLTWRKTAAMTAEYAVTASTQFSTFTEFLAAMKLRVDKAAQVV